MRFDQLSQQGVKVRLSLLARLKTDSLKTKEEKGGLPTHW